MTVNMDSQLNRLKPELINMTALYFSGHGIAYTPELTEKVAARTIHLAKEELSIANKSPAQTLAAVLLRAIEETEEYQQSITATA